MKRIIQALAIAALVLCVSAFGGCASNSPNNAQTGVFGIQQQYSHALLVGDWYGKLEFCDAPAHQPVCADRAVVIKIKAAKDVAGPSIAAAQATVRNPAFDESTANKITLSANAALQVLLAITGPLEDAFVKAVANGSATKGAQMVPMPAIHLNTAVLPLAIILQLLTQLLAFVPKGTELWNKYKADKDLLEQIIAEDRQPTDAEWDTLNAETAALEGSIDANAARAQAGN